MVKIKKTNETVFFTATDKYGCEQEIELNLNLEDDTYELCTAHEEHVDFSDKSKAQLELLMQALKAAVKYISERID